MMLLLLNTKTRTAEMYHPKWNPQMAVRQLHHFVWQMCCLDERLTDCTLIYAASDGGGKLTDLAQYEAFLPTQIEVDTLQKALIEQELKRLRVSAGP